jgi:hypothetical protein
MLLRITLACLVTSPLVACGGGSSSVDEDVEYQQLVDGFPDLETCLAETEGELFNCTRWLVLCANGGFELVVTDIVNEGLYTIDGDVITLRLESPGDAPDKITFRESGEGLASSQLGGSQPWLVTATGTESLESSCSALEGRTWFPR